MNENTNMNRREFLQKLGLGAGAALAMMAMKPLNILAAGADIPLLHSDNGEPNPMTYRVQHGSGEKISLCWTWN